MDSLDGGKKMTWYNTVNFDGDIPAAVFRMIGDGGTVISTANEPVWVPVIGNLDVHDTYVDVTVNTAVSSPLFRHRKGGSNYGSIYLITAGLVGLFKFSANNNLKYSDGDYKNMFIDNRSNPTQVLHIRGVVQKGLAH